MQTSLKLICARFLKMKNYDYYFVKCFEPKNKFEYFDIFHLAIIITYKRKLYFVDVGCGDYFNKPLLLEDDHREDNLIVKIDPELKIYNGENEIFKICNIANETEIVENYKKFFTCRNENFLLHQRLFDRYYDPINKKYFSHNLSKL